MCPVTLIKKQGRHLIGDRVGVVTVVPFLAACCNAKGRANGSHDAWIDLLNMEAGTCGTWFSSLSMVSTSH